jgi:hypothetical protein
MFSATAYTIRPATRDDEAALRQLAELDTQAPLAGGPILVGELGGTPQAALSIVDARVIANPFVATAQLIVHMRLRAATIGAHEREPSLRERIRVALSGGVVARPWAAQA